MKWPACGDHSTNGVGASRCFYGHLAVLTIVPAMPAAAAPRSRHACSESEKNVGRAIGLAGTLSIQATKGPINRTSMPIDR